MNQLTGKNIKSFDEFVNSTRNALEEVYGAEAEVSIVEMIKNNDQVHTGVIVKHRGHQMDPTIYLEAFYGEYLKNNNFGAVMAALVNYIDSHKMEHSFDVDQIADYEKARERICYRLVSKKRNVRLLGDVPHKDYLDLAIIYYVRLDWDMEGIASVIIKEEMLERWGVSLDEVHDMAHKNTQLLLPMQIKTIGEVVRSSKLSLSEDLSYLEEVNFYVVTVPDGRYGASCMLYDGFFEELTKYCGNRYAVIPSSINELIVVSGEMIESPEYIVEMIGCVNEAELKSEDVLGDVPYLYDDEEKRVEAWGIGQRKVGVI